MVTTRSNEITSLGAAITFLLHIERPWAARVSSIAFGPPISETYENCGFVSRLPLVLLRMCVGRAVW